VRKLFGWFVALAAAAAVPGVILTVVFYNESGWSDVGRSLLALAVTFSVGGAAAAALKAVDGARDDRAAWRDMLRDIVEVDQTLEVARQLIAAHKTAKTYSEQYVRILAARLILRRVWFDPLVANDSTRKGEAASIRDHLDHMKGYVDALGAEYERSYLPVARQQRIDEEYLKLRTTELAARTGPPPALDDPVYQPTSAWAMLRDTARFPLLEALLDETRFESSAFLTAYTALKPMLEQRAGIQQRRDGFHPTVLPTGLVTGHPDGQQSLPQPHPVAPRHRSA
jgi:hypothetical protein